MYFSWQPCIQSLYLAMVNNKRGFNTTTYLGNDLELDTQIVLKGVQDDDILLWSGDRFRLIRAIDGEFKTEQLSYEHLKMFRDMFQELMDELA
jgi:hypothetical protein